MKRSAQKVSDPAAQQPGGGIATHRNVDDGNATVGDALRAVGTQDGSFHADRRVLVHVPLDLVGDLARELSAAIYLPEVDRNGAHDYLCHRPALRALRGPVLPRPSAQQKRDRVRRDS